MNEERHKQLSIVSLDCFTPDGVRNDGAERLQSHAAPGRYPLAAMKSTFGPGRYRFAALQSTFALGRSYLTTLYLN